MKNSADVVIIGGGIIGAACAYYLSRTGQRVFLVERHFPASGTSRACDGLVLLWDKQPGTELSLGLQSQALWHQLNNELDADFRLELSGTIYLADGEEQLQVGRKVAESLGQFGQKAEILDSVALRNLEPGLAPDLAGGVLFPNDLQVDPRRATLALLSAAQQRGLKLMPHEQVLKIRRFPKGTKPVTGVVTEQREINTPIVICAAGVWSNQIASMVNIKLPLKPRKGHILVTSRAPGLIRHALLEGGYATTVDTAAQETQVAFVAEITPNGRLLFGSSREFSGFDRNVSLDVMRAIAARAARFLPDAANLQIMRSYAGLRPWSPDHLPLIGPVEDVPGFYLASGHEGAGIGLAPITGQLIADMTSGATSLESIEDIRPDRFEIAMADEDSLKSYQ